MKSRTVIQALGVETPDAADAFVEVMNRPRIKPPGGILSSISCCVCKSEILPSAWEMRRSPAGADYVLGVCKARSCRERMADRALCVCTNCRSMMLIPVDGKKAVDGFMICRGSTYHVTACAACGEGLTSVTLIEQQIASKNKII